MREDLRYIESLIEDKEYSSHPSDKELANFIDNKLLGVARDSVVEHLIYCSSCRDVVSEVIDYKKKSKFANMVVITPLVALVASLIVFVYLPSSSVIGMIDLSKPSFEFRAKESLQDKIVDGDKFIKELKSSVNLTYLKDFNQAEQEKSFDKAIGLYQMAINNIPENISEKERLKQTIVIRSRVLERAIKEKNNKSVEAYRSIIIDNIHTYFEEEK